MKNNILLILAVTIISIGIIVATVVISTAGNDNGEHYEPPKTSSSTGTSKTVKTLSPDTPDIIVEPTEQSSPDTAETSELPVIIPDTEDSTGNTSVSDITSDGIVATAQSLIGIDFIDGGDTPEVGFDNSGFVYYVLRENGYITCPREIYKQTEMGAALSFEQLTKGDLVYFYADDMTSVGFGGIYCGDGKMIACLMPGTQVKEINITTPYYTSHFYKGVSIT